MGAIATGKKGDKRLQYCKAAVATHGAVQHLIGEYEGFGDLVETMKNKWPERKINYKFKHEINGSNIRR